MAATVVLVHGASAGAWTWRDVRAGLDAKGISSVAMDLPSVTEMNPAIGLHEDAAHVRSAIDGVAGPVVLVGNSYGGAVISEAAAAHPSVKRLVYVAAFMPVAAEPLLAQLMPDTTDEFNSDVIRPREDGMFDFDEEAELRLGVQQAPPEQIEWIRENGARTMSFGADPNLAPAAAAWESIPSTFVVCTEDRAIKPDSQREWAKKRATDFVEWPSDHCPQHSHIDELVELLAKLATESG
jgi:pimeloyl-ACP methyl ester carboxylesterase